MRIFVLLFSVLLGGVASAGAPPKIPVQGYLTDASANAVDATVQIQFQVYNTATGGASLYSETQAVTVADGNLTVYLGSNVPLDLTLFRTGATYLGITIQGEAEMSPRLELATVPYAAYAQETGAVPPGAVMMFDLDACPPGWTALDAARGRAIVGTVAGGTRDGTVGSPLGDLENRAHSHQVGPFTATTSNNGQHSHSVTATTTTALATVNFAHTHSVDVPSHQHRWASYLFDPTLSNSVFRTFGANDGGLLGSITLGDWGDGMDSAGTGYYPLAASVEASTTPTYFYTQPTDIPAFTSGGASVTSSTHDHSVSISTTTSATGAHTHDVSLAATTSGTTASVMPYLQLLICKKD